VLDALGVTDGGAGDTFFFGAAVIGPDGKFQPAGGRRVVDGVDTDSAADWVIADSSLSVPSDQGGNNPTAGTGDDPDDPGGDIASVSIPEIQGADHESPYAGQKVETAGVVTAVPHSRRLSSLETAAAYL
jgi:predicted extracellular nuclease